MKRNKSRFKVHTAHNEHKIKHLRESSWLEFMAIY